MNIMRIIAVVLTFALASPVAGQSAMSSSSTPVVDLIMVYKSHRTMQLFSGSTLVKSYDIELGFSPTGDKLREGDGRTPEGTYKIDRRNPNSNFHLSLGISYPNTEDFSAARAQGFHPGGEIFIHGGPILPRDRNRPDWTAGCIAVTNAEIEEIWELVAEGVFIVIRP